MSEPTPTPGARLKAAREQRGLSAQKAADEMHLDAWVIDALESGDYARIGPAVYGKGHLRKYAALLDLPVGEIMSDFDTQSQPPISRGLSSIPVGSRHGPPPSRIVSRSQASATLAVVCVLISIMWWQPWERTRGANGAPAVAAAAVNAAAPGSVAVEVAGQATAADATASDITAAPPVTAPSVTARPVTAQASAPGAPVSNPRASNAGESNAGAAHMAGTPVAQGSASAPAAAGAVAGTPAAGRARLRLSFTSDSWVDVRDALGNRAFAGNGSANTVKTIAGNAPLHVYLRSANGVQLEINGRAVAIGPQFFSGDVARFEAGADGVLRRDTTRPEQTAARPPG
jgi:cytoskeleton protein RodZ